MYTTLRLNKLNLFSKLQCNEKYFSHFKHPFLNFIIIIPNFYSTSMRRDIVIIEDNKIK